MNPTDVRFRAFGEWLLEVSALLVVFPWLDQMVLQRSINWHVIDFGIGLSLILMVIGLYLVGMENES